jgi:hypothetical protein
VVRTGRRLLDDDDVELAGAIAPGEVAAQPCDDVEPDFPVLAGEAGEHLRHRPGHDILRHADADRGRAGRIREHALRLMLKRQDPPRIAQQALARCRRLDRAGDAIDQRDPDGILQPGELLADGRLRHVQSFGGLGEAAGIGDGDEGAEKAWGRAWACAGGQESALASAGWRGGALIIHRSTGRHPDI